MQMNFHRKLPIPQEVKKEYPLTERMAEVKAARDEAIRAVFARQEQRPSLFSKLFTYIQRKFFCGKK